MVEINNITKEETVVLFNIAQAWLSHLSDQLLEEKQKNEALNLRLLDIEHKIGKLGK